MTTLAVQEEFIFENSFVFTLVAKHYGKRYLCQQYTLSLTYTVVCYCRDNGVDCECCQHIAQTRILALTR